MGSSRSKDEDRDCKYFEEESDEHSRELKYGACIRNTVLAADTALFIAGVLMFVLESSIWVRLLGDFADGSCGWLPAPLACFLCVACIAPHPVFFACW